jgi:hypothetical protein
MLLSAAIFIAACVEVPTGASDILSLQFNPLPSPGVVIGDSLRDSLGIVRGVSVSAFNFSGSEVPDANVKFSTVDRGLMVDSVTGIVTGKDTIRSNARILATAGGLTVTTQVAIVPLPDTIIDSNARDSLAYSFVDTANISAPIGVKVLHTTATDTTGVGSWLVSFKVVSPTDTAFARLVGANGARSSLDTTDASGVAGRRIRIDVTHLTSAVDSVIVQAFVRYKGIDVRGSPARLVLKLKPK